MTGMLRAEWIKLRRRWVFRVLVLVLVALTGISAGLLLIVPEVAPDAIEGLPHLSRGDATIVGVQTVLGQTWFPLILAVVMLGSEVTTTAWASALTRESRRPRHLAARLIVLSGAAWAAALVAIAGWEILAAAYTEGAASFGVGDWAGVALKAAMVQTTWVALGLGAVALLRSTGVAIGVVVAYSFVEGLLALWRPFGEIALSGASSSLIGQTVADVSGGFGATSADPMSFLQAIVVVAIWALLGWMMAMVGLTYREA